MASRRRGGGGRRRRRGPPSEGGDDDRSDHIRLEGEVTQVYAGSNFEVTMENGAVVKAKLSGRMRRFRIRIVLGDRVTVALSPYDLSHGMIVYRSK